MVMTSSELDVEYWTTQALSPSSSIPAAEPPPSCLSPAHSKRTERNEQEDQFHRVLEETTEGSPIFELFRDRGDKGQNRNNLM